MDVSRESILSVVFQRWIIYLKETVSCVHCTTRIVRNAAEGFCFQFSQAVVVIETCTTSFVSFKIQNKTYGASFYYTKKLFIHFDTIFVHHIFGMWFSGAYYIVFFHIVLQQLCLILFYHLHLIESSVFLLYERDRWAKRDVISLRICSSFHLRLCDSPVHTSLFVVAQKYLFFYGNVVTLSISYVYLWVFLSVCFVWVSVCIVCIGLFLFVCVFVCAIVCQLLCLCNCMDCTGKVFRMERSSYSLTRKSRRILAKM